MAFTEFCCRSGGSNMNGGALASNAEPATAPVYSATNGGWNSATGVFTPTSGNPSATVTVGDFAHVFTDGSTTPTRIARVTAVNSTTVTLSTTAGTGTAPTTAGTGISINVGGAWAGPSGSSGFPYNFITSAMTDAANDCPRINFKNNVTYAITANINITSQGAPFYFQGYTTTFGDGGRSILDGGTSGASYNLLSVSGAGVDLIFVDQIFQNNGATGSATGVILSERSQAIRCVAHDFRGNGFENVVGVECEAYNCNKSNTANCGGFANTSSSGGGARLLNCVSHDNSGSNTSGFYSSASGWYSNCVADTNGADGFYFNGSVEVGFVSNCDAYNNTGSGFRAANSNVGIHIRNCNSISNGQYGLAFFGGNNHGGYLYNNGFFGNTLGQTAAATQMAVIGSVTYGASPYVDAANGDFRISSASAKGAGRGAFTQTAASYLGTIAYPDIGAAQHQETGGGVSGVISG